jgi:hypothetical protein
MMKGNRNSYRTCPACRRRPRAASKPLLSAVLGCGLLVAACHSQPTPGNPAEPTQGSTGRSGPDREETPQRTRREYSGRMHGDSECENPEY